MYAIPIDEVGHKIFSNRHKMPRMHGKFTEIVLLFRVSVAKNHSEKNKAGVHCTPDIVHQSA
jgi:hypothetical protein